MAGGNTGRVNQGGACLARERMDGGSKKERKQAAECGNPAGLMCPFTGSSAGQELVYP